MGTSGVFVRVGVGLFLHTGSFVCCSHQQTHGTLPGSSLHSGGGVLVAEGVSDGTCVGGMGVDVLVGVGVSTQLAGVAVDVPGPGYGSGRSAHGVLVGGTTGVSLGLTRLVGVLVGDGPTGVLLGVGVTEGGTTTVLVSVGVAVRLAVGLGVTVFVGVKVSVGVAVSVAVGVALGVQV